jgi:dipeptidyl aminopeptidase/acylaminoacyl peptidase
MRRLLSLFVIATAMLAVPAALDAELRLFGQSQPASTPTTTGTPAPPDFARMVREQEETDRHWRSASEGYMRMDKLRYRSSVGDLDIPAFVFQPLQLSGQRRHAALVWVHENIRGHLYEHYIPYIREATARGYVVIAPEYRGSIGYGKEFYDAIDYGGAEVDDVLSAVDVLIERYPAVDPQRIGIIGWSHGGLITLLATFRQPATFTASVAMVPVTNLFQRLAWKGPEQRWRLIDPQNRFGGLPWERREVYKDRSPLFHVDRLQSPLYVAVTMNDQDVNYEEARSLIDALRARKPFLAETRVYENPPGGHNFDRRVDRTTWQPENTREQRDSWNRVWTFLDWHLDPYRTASSQ